MFTDVEIRGFRCFRHLRVHGLASVNLLVGRNNTGKTAFLEAMDWAAADGASAVLLSSLIRRREVVRDASPLDRPSRAGAVSLFRPLLDVRHLFFGREIGDGTTATVSTGRTAGVRVIGDSPTDMLAAESSQARLEFYRSDLAPIVAYPLAPPGVIRQPLIQKAARSGLLATEGIPDARLARLFRTVAGNPEEELALEAARIVEPQIERVLVVDDDVFLRVPSSSMRVPLRSFGDGVRRLLTLAVLLVQARDRALLIDEVDTGLHFTALTPMWRLLVEGARRWNVQVFATTHSGDCVNSIGWLHRTEPDVVRDLALFRLDRDRPDAVRFGPDEIDFAVASELELRG